MQTYERVVRAIFSNETDELIFSEEGRNAWKFKWDDLWRRGLQ
jgi:hypothetical protein